MSFSFDCSFPSTTPFSSTLQVFTSCSSPSATLTDINDSLRLESFFLQQALSAAHAAKRRLTAASVPFTRPPTYHAHALKTAAHLHRIRAVQQQEAESQKAREMARKQRQLKKEAVKVQREREEEKMQERRETMKMGKTLSGAEVERVLSGKGGKVGKDGLGNANGTRTSSDSRTGNGNGKKNPSRPANSKRVFKNKKFGFGGRDKKMAKRNTKESSADMSGFSVKKMKGGFQGKKASKGFSKGASKGFNKRR